MTSYLLNQDDMEKLCGDNCLIMSYPDLYKYKSIEQLFSNGIEKVIILYLTDKRGNSYTGHWVCLLNHNGKIEFNDSYSYMPDSEIDFNNSKKKEMLNQKDRYLTKLLLDYVNRGGKVEYNEMRFQENGNDDISTCGRFAGVRAHFNEIGLKKYQNIFKKLRSKGYNLDDAIVWLSDEILGEQLG